MFLLQEAMPFAVVGSNTVIEANQKKVRGRQYPWGIAEGEKQIVNNLLSVCSISVKFACYRYMLLRPVRTSTSIAIGSSSILSALVCVFA